MNYNNFKEKGDIGESLFLYKCLKLHIPISKPFGDNQSYDFIIDINDKLYKVQVKTGTYNEENNRYSCLLTSCHYKNNKEGWIKNFYKESKVDLFAFVCIEKSKIVLIPFKLLKENQQSVIICFDKKESSIQTKNRWFYEDYYLAKIINSLKENKEIISNHSLESDKEKFFEDAKLNKAYIRAINSESGYRGVSVTKKKGFFKSHVFIEKDKKTGKDVTIYVGSSNNPKELAMKYDKIAEELLGDNAITNRKLGLL